MKDILIVIVNILFIVSITGIHYAEVLPATLDQFIKRSSVIVLGKVTEKKEDVAEIEVLQVLKGNIKVNKLRIWIKPTSPCDISDAVENEQAIYFLYTFEDYFPSEDSKQAAFNPDTDYFLITDLGRGRWTVKHMYNDNYIAFPTYFDFLPNKFKSFPKLKSIDGEVEFFKLDYVISYILKKSKKHKTHS